MSRFILPILIAVLMCCKAPGAAVTLTLSLNENALGQCAPNSFVLYATPSRGDNFGLQAFGVDLKQEPLGGPRYTSLTNRSPGGFFTADSNDPDYDPNIEYAQRPVGFTLVRNVDPGRGTIGGQIDIHPGSPSIRVGGFGQTAGNINDHRPPPIVNPPESQNPGSLVDYRLANLGLADISYGTTAPHLPQGSLRLGTGTWSGTTLPSFDIDDADNLAWVWTDSALTRQARVPVIFSTIDFCVIPEPGALCLLASPLIFLRRRRLVRV